MAKQLLITVKGKVQGVFFRATTRDKAESLSLKGWVKNNSDGTVNILAQGNQEKIDQFLNWCKEGPQSAKVENISTMVPETQEQLDSFEIRY